MSIGAVEGLEAARPVEATRGRLFAPQLRKGCTIGVIALSSPVSAAAPRRLSRGLAAVEALGFSIREAPSLRGRLDSSRSASPEARADELNAMFRDDSITMILSAIGGYTTIEVLPHLDLDLIAQHPKILVGYSDTGVLQAALWQALGLVSVSGPALLPQFGDAGGIDAFTADAFLALVSSPTVAGRLPHPNDRVDEFPRWDIDDDLPRVARRPHPLVVLRDGCARGRLIPVNTESLLALAGTRWFPDLDGAIVVLEASDATAAGQFAQQMAHLRELGAFRKIAGLAFGRFHPASQITLELVADLVCRTVDSSIPVLAEIAFGHTDPMLSLPWGIDAQLVCDDDPYLELSEPAVR